MKTLRRDLRGPEVERWQLFLLGQGFDVGAVDGEFGDKTFAATERFQRLQGLGIDGVVGPVTYGRAMQLGLDPVAPDKADTSKLGPNWPAPKRGLKSPSDEVRVELFGTFRYEPAPTPGNPEGITILGTWQRDNLRQVAIPQLIGVPGAHSKGHVTFHRAGTEALKSTFAAWEQAGLLHLLLSWAGSFNPRFIRGSRETLSNHAYGTAFDINAAWNPLGARPALVGKRGSVRELVPIAQDHGFAWGGHFKGRPDGMHFELVKV
jgi:peptidoglycan hydrolase-like protein with peptidoglycan-binding domain